MLSPILFLDIDGVLNHQGLYSERSRTPGKSTPVEWLDRACVARVNGLCARTGAAVVISSSWRRFSIPGTTERGWRGAVEVLRAAGFAVEVVDGTPELGEEAACYRWPEIRAWLDAHPEVSRWAILDDMALDGVPEGHHVRTDPRWGLTDADVDAIAQALA